MAYYCTTNAVFRASCPEEALSLAYNEETEGLHLVESWESDGSRRWQVRSLYDGDIPIDVVMECHPVPAVRGAADSLTDRDGAYTLACDIAAYMSRAEYPFDTDDLPALAWNFLIALYEDPGNVDRAIAEAEEDIGDRDIAEGLRARLRIITGTGVPFGNPIYRSTSRRASRGRRRCRGSRTGSS